MLFSVFLRHWIYVFAQFSLLMYLLHCFLASYVYSIIYHNLCKAVCLENHFLIKSSFFWAAKLCNSRNIRSILRDIVKIKLAPVVEGDSKCPFSIATTPRCRGRRFSFPGLLHFTFDTYIIMLSVKQGSIKYHFVSLWYVSTWYSTLVFRAVDKHSTHKTNEPDF